MSSQFIQIATFGGIILATFLVAFLVRRFFKRLFQKATELTKTDPTKYHFLQHSISAIIYLTGFGIAIYSVPSLRTLASGLLAGAGIMAVAIGFASQQALSNVIGGLFIVIFKPFRIGDRLEIRTTLTGVVEDISLRHTVIRDFSNRRIIIPNSVISNEVIINSNFGETKMVKWIDVTISYESDLAKAKQIIHDEIVGHPLHIDTRTPEEIANGDALAPVRVMLLADTGINLRGWAWAANAPDAFVLGCDVLENIKLKFDEAGIEIPYPHRTVVIKGEKNKSIDLTS